MKVLEIIKLGLRPTAIFLYSFCLVVFTTTNSHAQNQGQLDPTFGIGGKVSTLIQPAGWGNQTPIILLPDGKFLIATTIVRSPAVPFVAVARYLPDGSLDNTWANNGISVTEVDNSLTLRISDIKLLPDGKILAAGFRDSMIGGFPTTGQYMLKYENNGTLDVSFGDGGKLTRCIENETSIIYKIAIIDNKIITIGRQNTQVSLNAFDINTGELDTTWGNNGIMAYDMEGLSTPIQHIIVTSDNKILAAEQGRIYRYFSNGQRDSSFGQNRMGYITPLYARQNNNNLIHSSFGNSYGLTMILQEDNKIILAGIASPYSTYAGKGILERYHANGEFDSTFADNGVLAADFRSADLGINYINKIVADTDGNIIVAGNVKDTITGRLYFALAKYDIYGEIDSSFGYNGMNTVSFHSTDSIDYCHDALVQPDGKIVLAGFTPIFSSAINNIPLASFSLARFESPLLSSASNYAQIIPTITIFPNPVTTQFTINSPQSNIEKICLYTIQGQEQKSIIYSDNTNQIQVDLTNCPDAIYFLHIQFQNGQKSVHKILKTK